MSDSIEDRPARATIERLAEAVRCARHRQFHPPPGHQGPYAIVPLSEHLDTDATQWIWQVIRAIKADEPELYDELPGESYLAALIIDALSEEDSGDWEGLVQALRTEVEERSDWLVSVPLANAALAEDYHEISDRIGLARPIQDRDWDLNTEQPAPRSRIYQHLGDYIALPARWLPTQHRLAPLDTRRTAVLLMREAGTRPVAVRVARTRALCALGFWCLLRPPTIEEVWPSLGDWQPRPYIRHELEHKEYEERKWTGRAKTLGAVSYEYGEYALPASSGVLRAPFRAMDLAGERVSARAILSTASALYAAERYPSQGHRTDQLALLVNAIDALCDLGQEPTGDAGQRWARVTERRGVWRAMRSEYAQEEIEDAKALTRDLRNIAMHGSDDVLVNLGYPRDQVRRFRGGKERSGAELALARVDSAAPILRHAVYMVATEIAQEGLDSDWDDAVYRRNFEK